MAQKFDYPKSESELRAILDSLYKESSECFQRGERPSFKGLLEIISATETIVTAIHNIKANKGSRTPGSDGETIETNILQRDFDEIVTLVKESLVNYSPKPIRREFIPKANSNELRPLGIPTIVDRVIQECVRIVIEPIVEAQFFQHSYGFRPMRDAYMALERAKFIIHHNSYHWVVEGDISKFFDNVNHTILIKRLYGMGIRDKRVLMIIKAMLKAGVMNETKSNSLGTPQGGIISPLLANVYLDALDQWITREWENRKLNNAYSRDREKFRIMRKTSMKPAFFVRYADDWVLITNSRDNAEKWKARISRYLKTNLKLTLSEEKTLVTNVTKKPIKFLGFTLKMVKGKSKSGYISRSKPCHERLKCKVLEVKRSIRKLRTIPGLKSRDNELFLCISKINSQIRGMIQYYEAATFVNIELAKYARNLRFTAYKALLKAGGKWVEANKVNNLTSIHSGYELKIPAVTINDTVIGITDLYFSSWSGINYYKNPKETPYTYEGRELYRNRTGKKPLRVRADMLLSTTTIELSKWALKSPIYNTEFVINRCYAYNRDKGKCKVCGKDVNVWEVKTHHIDPRLTLNLVNKVNNLSSLHDKCHRQVHSSKDYSNEVSSIAWKNILKFREKLTAHK